MRKIVFFIILLFIISCDGGGIKPIKQTGTEAIQITFLKDNPPTIVIEENKFNIVADIENVGFGDIQQGIITFSATSPAVEILGKKEESLSLKGKEIYTPKGEKTLLQRTALARELPQKSQTTTSILINACFNYKTQASANICIDTQQGKSIRKPCQMSAASLSGGQGGPVAVTRIEYNMMPHDFEDYVTPEFKIYLSKVGSGNMEIMREDKTAQACHLDVELEYKDVVKVKAKLGDQDLKCNTKEINFNEESYVVCELEEGISKTRGTYTTVLTTEISYGYKITANKPITIKRL